MLLAARCTRPLARLCTQFGIADTAQVITGNRVVEAAYFLIHRFGIGVVEGVGIAHGTCHAGNDLPVRQTLPGGLDSAWHQGEVALAVDHHTLAFGPQRGRQQDVGVTVGFGVEEGVLGNDQLGLAQAVDHLLAVGDTGHRVAADNPAGFHFTGFHLPEQRHRTLAALAAQAAGWKLPLSFDECAVIFHQR